MRDTPSKLTVWMRRCRVIAAVAAAALAPQALMGAFETRPGLDNVTLTLAGATYHMPRLELEGASLSSGEFADLFKGGDAEIDVRLARLSARRMIIPTLTTERRSGEGTARAVYRDVTAENVVAGRIGLLRVGGLEQTVEKAGAASRRYLWGGSVSKGVDLRQFAHLALARRADSGETAKPLIDEESVDSLVARDTAAGVETRTGRLTIRGVKGRAASAPLGALLAELENLSAAAADPALLARVIDAVASVDVDSFEARDIVTTGEASAAKPYRLSVGRVAAARILRGAIGDLIVEDVSLHASDGGTLGLKQLGLRDAKLSSIVDSPYPRFGRIEAAGLVADLPDPRLDAASRMTFSVSEFSADFANFRDNAPTKFAARLDGLSIDLSARGDAPSVAQFRALGYDRLDLSGAAAAEWREATEEAVISPVHVEGKDMGAATLSAQLENVSGAVFAATPVISKAASLAVALKSIDLTLENGGLVDRLVFLAAREEKKPEEKARAEYAKAAATAIAALFGEGEKAKNIGAAVAAFVERPGRLHVRLASKKGVNGLEAFARKPADILEGVEIEAVAER